MGIRFTQDEAKAMAVYVAQLTREGIAYNVTDTGDGWVITATGF
jgi:hypothetical protein